MTSVDLSTFRLRPGELRQVPLELALEPLLLGGQRYEMLPAVVPAELVVSQAAGAMLFDLELEALLVGPCMRCLGVAEVGVRVSAREFHDSASGPTSDLRSDYVVDERLRVSDWARDVIALEVPEQILCRPDCAGLCAVCGKDLNFEPHEHAAREIDPRWAALEGLRDRF